MSNDIASVLHYLDAQAKPRPEGQCMQTMAINQAVREQAKWVASMLRLALHNEQQPAPAAPVTDDGIAVAIDALEAAAFHHGDQRANRASSVGEEYDTGVVREQARQTLVALIARRIQQATAAAEELARAAESAVLMMSTKNSDALRTALAAFRAARGTP